MKKYLILVTFLVPVFALAQLYSAANTQAIQQGISDVGGLLPNASGCIGGLRTGPQNQSDQYTIINRADYNINPFKDSDGSLTKFQDYIDQPANADLKKYMSSLSNYGPNAIRAFAELVIIDPPAVKGTVSVWAQNSGAGPASALAKLQEMYQPELEAIKFSSDSTCQAKTQLLLSTCKTVFTCQLNVNGQTTTDLNTVYSNLKNVSAFVGAAQASAISNSISATPAASSPSAGVQ
jgi:hypothetical protein